MSYKLERLIENLKYEGLTILQVSNLLEEDFDLSMISQALTRIYKRKEIVPPNTFGKCGIDSRANPCGDACEYQLLLIYSSIPFLS